MKRKWMLVALVIGFLVMSGLGAFAQGVTIHWASRICPWLDACKVQLPEFEKENPDIKVIVDEMDNDPLREKTMIDFTTGTGTYDVVNAEQGWVFEYNGGGFLEPLDSYISKNNIDMKDFFQPAVDYWGVWNGKIYELPFDIDTRVFFYRKDIFKLYGIREPKGPNDYYSKEEFIKVLQKVNHPEAGYYAMGSSGANYGTADLEWRGFLYSFGAPSVLDMKTYKPLVNSPAGIEALSYYVEIGKYAPPSHVTWLWDDLLHAAQQGTVVMSIQPTTFAGALMDPNQSKISDNVGWFAYPQKGKLPVTGVYGGWGIGISKFSKHKEEAFRLIKYLLDPQVSAERAKNASVGPAQLSVFKDPEVIAKHPEYPFALERLKSAKGFIPRLPINAQIADIIDLQINLAFVTGKSPKQAMDDASKDITEVLKRAGYIK
jgi:multiple sugar transport system substrate-binding protein